MTGPFEVINRSDDLLNVYRGFYALHNLLHGFRPWDSRRWSFGKLPYLCKRMLRLEALN